MTDGKNRLEGGNPVTGDKPRRLLLSWIDYLDRRVDGLERRLERTEDKTLALESFTQVKGWAFAETCPATTANYNTGEYWSCILSFNHESEGHVTPAGEYWVSPLLDGTAS